MKCIRYSLFAVLIVLLSGCGKSRQLTPLLPDAPAGWKTEGSAANKDVSGIGHSATRSYIPANAAAGLGAQRVTVQILLGEKGADQKQLQSLSIEKEASFKEKREVGGFPAYESFPLPDDETHSLDIVPASGKWVQIVAYKGGAEWGKTGNQAAIVSAFASAIDLKKFAAQE
jgi:hypothetical protein